MAINIGCVKMGLFIDQSNTVATMRTWGKHEVNDPAHGGAGLVSVLGL